MSNKLERVKQDGTLTILEDLSLTTDEIQMIVPNLVRAINVGKVKGKLERFLDMRSMLGARVKEMQAALTVEQTRYDQLTDRITAILNGDVQLLAVPDVINCKTKLCGQSYDPSSFVFCPRCGADYEGKQPQEKQNA